jgi:molybdopterin-containing oxidoreductase family iron-sulfur binding subunit
MRDIDLAQLRARLEQERGQRWWRGLDELADTPEFRDMLHREFPEAASEFDDPKGRRDFLKLMGASLALAGVTACTRQPPERIVPYVRQPEEIVPGKPLFFATAMPFAGAATPVLVESHMGRPTKVEANPEHPATRGGTDVFSQASVLQLYDPDRSKAVKHLDAISTWGAFTTMLAGAMNAQRALQGAGLRIVTETVTSPTLAAQLQAIVASMPQAKWVQWEPVSRDHVRAGAKLAFGEYVEPQYRFDQADIVLSLDADFLTEGPGRLRHARDFIAKRRLTGGETAMNRLYVVESTPSPTGVKADHRVRVRAGDVEHVARAVAAGVGVAGQGGATQIAGLDGAVLKALVADLSSHRGRSLVVAGETQPPAVHALAHALNQALGNVGTTVVYTATPEAVPSEQLAALTELAGEMEAGKVDVLVIISANPVYAAPPDLRFADRMNKVGLRIHVGLYEDETAELCHWHIPDTHYLETWSDARAFDGTVTICQPLVAPLYDNVSPHQFVSALAGRSDRTAHDLVREFWTEQFAGGGSFGALSRADGTSFGNFDDFWRQALHDGFIAGSAFPARTVAAGGALPAAAEPAAADALELTFRPDPNLWDGRFANLGWLQELPRPITKIVWDNVVVMSPSTASALGVANEDVLALTVSGQTVNVPVWTLPGQPDRTLMVTIGHGRRRAGRVGNAVGVDVNAIRPSQGLWRAAAFEARKAGGRYRIACTQGHFSLEGRNHVRVATLGQYRHDPEFAHHLGHEPGPEMTLHGNEWKYEGNAWGMSVDLNACTGCNACVVACQAENNIPVVGKEQVLRQREMHWIRIDRYYTGGVDDPEMFYQPMMCQHCETAPCEVVCPVAATTHSDEGLNDMVYNRCVGTRYCSHNCPYKVRRFNFFLYSDWTTPSLRMVRNPDVTVRSRGVMEKCTFCVQRISLARIDAKRENRAIRDGEIATACEGACPTQAIVFGNINDPAARVTALKKEPRTYGVLAELNTRPRTTYLAAVRNPHPDLAPATPAGAEHTPAETTH